MKRRFEFSALLLAGLLTNLVSINFAQETRATLIGQVSDPNGGALAGATVVAINVETNVATRSTTNESGRFEIPFLLPGQYEMRIEMRGFKQYVRRGITLNVSSRLEVNATVEVGDTADSVTVTSSAPLLETTTASSGGVVDNRRLNELPSLFNNATTLSALIPGMHSAGINRQPRRPALARKRFGLFGGGRRRRQRMVAGRNAQPGAHPAQRLHARDRRRGRIQGRDQQLRRRRGAFERRLRLADLQVGDERLSRNAHRDVSEPAAQDKFSFNRKLTLELGLRYEYEGSIRDRFNRGLRDFDFGAQLPFTSAAQAAYVRNPLPEVAAAQFAVRGGSN